MSSQSLGVVTDTEYVVLTPSEEPPPNGNGEPPPPPPETDWGILALLGIFGLLFFSGRE